MGLSKEQRDWLRLIMVPGVGTTHFVRLLARFHAPANVLKASPGALKEVVGPTLAERIAQYADAVDVDGQQRLIDEYGATLITLEDSSYPVRLAEIYDPPLALFVRGDLHQADDNCVAIVGTRRATPYGIRMAETFGYELAARGVTVISGLASGIDAAAHKGAIAAGGRTIAVLGCGVDIVYPPQNADLMHQIINGHGCVLSQFMMGVKPSRGHFPYRNRIISGLSLGTLVVEAPIDSGALITARQAAEQGREVFAIPGQIGMNTSRGPHALIREGAKLVETVDDIMVELELPVSLRQKCQPQEACDPSDPSDLSDQPRRAPARATQAPPPAKAPVIPKGTSTVEQDILSALSRDGSFVDEIAAACRIPVSEALSSLTLLELKGLVRQYSGKRFAPA